MIRRLTALFLVMAALVVTGIALPTSASALPIGPDCKSAPTPEVPGRGVEGFFHPAPAAPPAAADPFAPGAKTTIEEQYGYAGLRWNTYDLGCLGGVSSPENSVGTTVANWIFTVPKTVVAGTGALLDAAYAPDFLGVFDPLISSVVDALRRSIFDQWIGLMVAAVGFLVIWRARQASLASTAAAIGWALLVMVIATAVFRWPVQAGKAADTTVVATMSGVTGALAQQNPTTGKAATGAMAAGNLHQSLLYQVWLGGEFGDANSVAARKYGAQLFDAQALTWSEAAALSQDPAAGQRLIEAKKAKWQQVAAAVQAEDPDAYEYLTGRRTDARVGFAALAVLAVACAVPFLVMAALLIVGALVITRFSVMMFPAIATLGLFPAMRSLVTGVGNTVAAALLNSLVFGVATAVMVKALGVVMAPGTGLPAWLVVALLLLLTLIMWMTLRPFRRLTHMVAPGYSLGDDTLGVLGGLGKRAGALGGRAGGRAAGAAGTWLFEDVSKKKDEEEDAKAKAKAGRRAEADGPDDPQGDDGRALTGRRGGVLGAIGGAAGAALGPMGNRVVTLGPPRPEAASVGTGAGGSGGRKALAAAEMPPAGRGPRRSEDGGGDGLGGLLASLGRHGTEVDDLDGEDSALYRPVARRPSGGGRA